MKTGPLRTLHSFLQPRRSQELCELCGARIDESHPHLWVTAAAQLVCACHACHSLLADVSDGPFRAVTERVTRLTAAISDQNWHALGVPIGLAFFRQRAIDGCIVATYPSPLGLVESPLDRDAWQTIVAQAPQLQNLEPDVEAILCDRTETAARCYRLPITQCYRLVGILRTHWRGFDGGDQVRIEVTRFLDSLDSPAPCDHTKEND